LDSILEAIAEHHTKCGLILIMSRRIKFYRMSQLPAVGEVGSMYFIHGESPTLWLYTLEGWENYSSGDGGFSFDMINTTYTDLKAMVSTGSLIPGM
jgi:hypothetical protein